LVYIASDSTIDDLGTYTDMALGEYTTLHAFEYYWTWWIE